MTYNEFWLRYLRAHSRPSTRAMHYIGSVLALGTLVIAIATLNWRGLIAAPLIGYAFAWTAHSRLERIARRHSAIRSGRCSATTACCCSR